MAILTKYRCDRCGQFFEKRKDLWCVAVIAKNGADSISSYLSGKRLSNDSPVADWCRACMVTMGILPSVSNDPPAPDPKPTLEDLIVEIVKDALANRS